MKSLFKWQGVSLACGLLKCFLGEIVQISPAKPSCFHTVPLLISLLGSLPCQGCGTNGYHPHQKRMPVKQINPSNAHIHCVYIYILHNIYIYRERDMYIHMCQYKLNHVRIHIHVCLCACTCVYIHIQIETYMYTRMCVYIYIYIYPRGPRFPQGVGWGGAC